MLTKTRAQQHLTNSPTFANSLATLKELFMSSGLFALLMENAKPQEVDAKNPNFSALSAAEMHRSAGYFQALEDVLNFREKFLTNTQVTTPAKGPMPDFGGTEALVKRGIISEKEADDLRTKQRITKHPAAVK